MRVYVLGTLLIVVSACGAAPPAPLPPTNQARAVRLEQTTPERNAWLHEHCRVVGVQSESGELLRSRHYAVGSSANVMEVISVGRSRVQGYESHLIDVVLFACPATPPWPREDTAEQRRYVSGGLASTCSPTEHSSSLDGGEVEMLREGQGAGVTDSEAYARVRLRTVALRRVSPQHVYHGRTVLFDFDPDYPRTSTEPEGLIEHDGPETEHVFHRDCFEPCVRRALAALREGGRARVSCSTYSQVEVELVEVGGEQLFLSHLGLPTI